MTEAYQARALTALTAHDTIAGYIERTQHQNLLDLRYKQQDPVNEKNRDQVQNNLLREVMQNLDDARQCLERAQIRVETAHELQAAVPRPVTTIAARLELFSKTMADLSETDHLSGPAQQAIEEMDPHTAVQLMANTGSAAAIGYYAQAVRHLAHADFVISNISRDLQETRR